MKEVIKLKLVSILKNGCNFPSLMTIAKYTGGTFGYYGHHTYYGS